MTNMSCSVISSLDLLYSDRYIWPLITRYAIVYKYNCPLVIKNYNCINDFSLIRRKDLFNYVCPLVSTSQSKTALFNYVCPLVYLYVYLLVILMSDYRICLSSGKRKKKYIA